MDPLTGSTSFNETLDFQQKIARLQALLETSRQVHATISLDAVLKTALRIAVRELELAGAAVTQPPLQYGQMPPTDWSECLRFPLRDSYGHVASELVLHPGRALTFEEADFLEGLALQVAVAAQNARFHERDLQWARVQQDLAAARLLQRSLLPQRMPELVGYDLAIRSSTCYEVGGDYTDVVCLPNGNHLMLVADVAGKGLASAIVSTSFRSVFRALAVTGLPLAELANRLNQHHWDEGVETRRKYVTAIFLLLDCARARAEVVNAGHNPGILLRPGDESAVLFGASAPPIGMLPHVRYDSTTAYLPPGSRLLLYTDGLTEVFHGEEEFGPDRLLRCFLGCDGRACAPTLDQLWDAIGEFSGGAPQEDDMTALALYRERQDARETAYA